MKLTIMFTLTLPSSSIYENFIIFLEEINGADINRTWQYYRGAKLKLMTFCKCKMQAPGDMEL